ncbi:exonuclease nef-sp, putative, partial [Ixodes scapularis]
SAAETVEQPSDILYLQDIQNLLLVALMGNETPYLTRWCRYLRSAKTSHIVVVMVSGLSVDMLAENPDWFPKLSRLFPDGGVRVVPAAQYGATTECELTQVPNGHQDPAKGNDEQNGHQGAAKGNDELEEGQLVDAKEITLGNANPNDVVPRTLFLLSPVQMLHEGYPLLKAEATKDYVYTNRSYLPVSNRSRLFSIDCEMCLTTAKCNELARVTLIDEDEKVLLDELVKPRNRIVNYLTQFSGITKKMLDPVTTRVEDVQKAIIRLLPPDAILVGQSLNFDLHALHMIHPYVIDSSVIYNLTGNRNHKSKLKLLSSTFLGQEIQMSKEGHSSEEDSLACLRLVKLRLQKGLFFGDAILRDKEQELQEKALEMARNGEAIDVNLFYYLGRDKHKKTAHVVGTKEMLENYPKFVLNATQSRKVNGNKKAVKEAKALMDDNHLLMVGLKAKAHKELLTQQKAAELDKHLEKIYRGCQRKSLFVVLLQGCFDKDTRVTEHGLCFVTVKEAERRSPADKRE